MTRASLLLLGLLAFVVLGGWCLTHAGEIEERVRAAGQARLEGVQVAADGRDLVLRGFVTSEAERLEAERIAWTTPGVRTVLNLLEVRPEEPDAVAEDGGLERLRRLLAAHPVRFRTNSAALDPNAREILDELAEALAASPEAPVAIEGHADSRSSEPFNLDLSRRRAEAVRDYLASRGLAARRLRIVALGELDPVAGNDTAEGRRRNRRVVLRLEGDP